MLSADRRTIGASNRNTDHLYRSPSIHAGNGAIGAASKVRDMTIVKMETQWYIRPLFSILQLAV